MAAEKNQCRKHYVRTRHAKVTYVCNARVLKINHYWC